MLTNFGKMCRKIRIDNNQVLYNMARILDVTPSFLSSVENGKKNVPDSWCETIRKEYNLGQDTYEELIKAKEASKTQVKLNLEKCKEDERNLVFSFARCFDKLSDEQREKIMDILNE